MECQGRRSPFPPSPPEPETAPTSPPIAIDPSLATAPAPPLARDPGSSEPMPPSDDPEVDADTDTGIASHDPQEPAAEEAEAPPPPAANDVTDDLRDKIVTQINEVIPPIDDLSVDAETDVSTTSHDTQVPGIREVPPLPAAIVLTDDLLDKLVTQNNDVIPPVDDPNVDTETDPGTASHDPQVPVGDVPPPPAATVLTDDLRDKIVAQVEYYFSDTNLPTDKFLLKYVKRDKHGFVPIGVISSFKKMKKLVQDISLIIAALRTSSQLVVNANGTKVKRLHPLPDSVVKDNQSSLSPPCTIIVENLPGNYSKDSIQRLFGNVGNISNITIHDPHSTEESTSRKGEIAISSKKHALVEYETVEAAEKAVAFLNDEKNWSGMRVELLLKRMKKYGLIQRGHKENLSEKGNIQTLDVGMDGQMTNSVDRQGETVQMEDSSGGKSRRQSRYKSRGRGQQNSNGQGHGHVHSNCIGEGTSKPIAGPKMPDGTRGFTMGRGKPAPNSLNIEML